MSVARVNKSTTLYLVFVCGSTPSQLDFLGVRVNNCNVDNKTLFLITLDGVCLS